MKTLCALAVLLFGIPCFGQVQIVLAKTSFATEERIQATVSNKTHEPISFCVEVLSSSDPKTGKTEITPFPFLVQVAGKRRWKHLFMKHWGTVLMGWDIGRIRAGSEMAPGESQEFPFLLGVSAGEARLVLTYWKAPNSKVCSSEEKNGQKLISKTFRIASTRSPQVQAN